MEKTKIIATIGPSSMQKTTMKAMFVAGMDAIRINTAHGDRKQYKKIIETARSIADIPIILDVKGPEIRICSKEVHNLKKGETVFVSFKQSELCFNNPFHAKKAQAALINDGMHRLEIFSVKKDGIILKALEDLSITDKVRINIPGVKYTQPILSSEDLKNLEFGIKEKIEYLALSYVRDRHDISSVKKKLKNSNIGIISKIETQEGIDNFDEILEESDGIMIARGDLGVELSSERLPMIQKDLIRKCNNAGKLVITATQMLQSMIDSPVPTRAETSDVANAILDGSDAVMLSGETAKGKHPLLAVREMGKIAREVEPYIKIELNIGKAGVSEAISKSIYEITKILPVTKIITLTRTGYTARIISRFRLDMDIFAMSEDESVKKKLSLYYGVIPFTIEALPLREKIRKAVKMLHKKGLLKMNDLVLFTAGIFTSSPGETNLLEIHKAKDLIEN